MNADRLLTLIKLAFDPNAIRGLLFWSKFSVASYTLISSLKKQGIVPQTVIDVGANAGQFAVSAAKLYPGVEIHCFEPVPGSYQFLRKNTARLKNIHLYDAAVSDSVGETEIHVNSHSHSSSILELSDSHIAAFPGAEVLKLITVPVTTLDAALGDCEFGGQCLMKIDVQGLEGHVIAGAHEILSRCHYVVMEASLKPMYKGEKLFLELIEVMQDCGYEFLRPVGALSDPKTGEVLQIDALFGRMKESSSAAVGEHPLVGET